MEPIQQAGSPASQAGSVLGRRETSVSKEHVCRTGATVCLFHAAASDWGEMILAPYVLIASDRNFYIFKGTIHCCFLFVFS